MNAKRLLVAANTTVFSLALACVSGFTHAAIIWDQSPTAVGGTLLGPFSNQAFAQNFADRVSFATAQLVGGMDIYTVDSLANVGDAVTIRIRAASATAVPLELSSVVSIEDASGIGGSGNVRIHASFPVAVPLLSGTTYWFGMSGTTKEIGQFTLGGATGPLIDNLTQRYHMADFVGDSDGDMAFRLHDVAAIPEPSTYALMLAGLGFVGYAARRRRKARSAA